MKLKDIKKWNSWKANNKDPYGSACIAVAEQAMIILDEGKEFDTHKLICEADDKADAGGITGFMAGAVAQIISECHERGEEFRLKWNKDNQIKDEGDKANKEKGAILNPAVIKIGK